MIREGILSSVDQEGRPNFAPVGVILSEEQKQGAPERVEFRLYPGSCTYHNLTLIGEAVICFTEDVTLFVETALYSFQPPTLSSCIVQPPRLREAVTVWEILITDFDQTQVPAVIEGKVVAREEGPGFLGFCRAQAAVLEATIAATRWHRRPALEITGEWPRWSGLVRKTGGFKERQAFNRVAEYLEQKGIGVAKVEKMSGGLT